MDLPVTTPTSILLNQMTWRKQQLSWFAEPVIIKQDQELIDYIKHNNIQQAIMYGDTFFSQHTKKVDTGPVDLIIWIQNQPFKFDQLLYNINREISTNLSDTGTFYLAVNKFLCNEPQLGIDFPEDYDHAILQYMEHNVNAVLKTYFLDCNAVGTMFNWVHPLTRFYFQK
jgi:hypothetical protein